MAEVLKQALRSLCTKTGWCYAVFWKLKRRSRMVLTWEEGHYDALQSGLARSPLEHGLCRQTEDQIHLAVVKMSFHVHSLGEGIVGRVAFTAKHQWVYGGDKQPGEASGQTSSDKYPDGWSNQFAAGIKTIAVVAVPQGVVQLGSMQLMPEDLNLVGQIRALFGTLQSVPGAVVSDLTYEGQARRSAAIPRAPTTLTTAATPPPACLTVGSNIVTKGIVSAQNRNCGAAAITGFLAESAHSNHLLADQKATFDFQHSGAPKMRTSSLWPSGYLKHPSEVSQFQPPATYDSRIGHSRGQVEGDPLLDLLRPNAAKPAADSIQFGPVWSPSSFGVGGFEGLQSSGADTATTGLLDPDDGFDYNSLFKALQKDDLDDFNWLLATLPEQVPASSGSNFVMGDELSEALVPQVKNGPGYNSAILTPPSEDVKAEKQFQFEPRPAAGYCDILLGLTQKKSEPLLDAVVAGASVTPDPMKSVREIPSATGASPAGSLLPVQSATVTSSSAPCKDSHLPDNTPAAAAAAAAAASAVKWSSSLQVKPAGCSWAAEACQMKKAEEHTSRDTSSSSRKQDDATRTTGRKRLRPGETPRPRPKDRQQIQDRVRELRDIVPNATKCSIDSLLEKTIKHMQFLQSVTQHGDKWKAGGDLKIGGMLERHNMDTGGASWAMEVGSKGPCPIVVENLRQPGQMLVEMLCEEKGLFWEIADNIRNLGLIILKGVMESRNDKVWARFNVEMQASREVDRVQVLWNLLQLLKPNNSKQQNGGTPAASSFTGSEITDVCSESLAHHGGIMVSSANW